MARVDLLFNDYEMGWTATRLILRAGSRPAMRATTRHLLFNRRWIENHSISDVTARLAEEISKLAARQ